MKTIRVLLLTALAGLSFQAHVSAFYNPSTGRWPNRDPISERGGKNLYAFADNTPITHIDLDGRASWHSTIQLCNRQIENPANSFLIGCCNLRGHDFFRWPDGNEGYVGIGFDRADAKGGELPRPDADPERARLCYKCEKSGKVLKHGKGKGKVGYDASDEEIQDCLSKRPIEGAYNGLLNNCNDWANWTFPGFQEKRKSQS
jgi:uncharacterized protein RhaS with RHS repeats